MFALFYKKLILHFYCPDTDNSQKKQIQVYVNLLDYIFCKIEGQNSIKPENIHRSELDNDHDLRLVCVSPNLESRPWLVEHTRKKVIAIRLDEITHHPITHHTTQQAEQQQQLLQ